MTGTPLLVHEQNRAPGMTNRVLARMAVRLLTGFPDTFVERREEWVGNPVRAEIAAIDAPDARFTARTGPLRVLVLGGSQGARALNTAVPQAVAALRGEIEFDVLHQSGETLHADAMRAYADAWVQARVEPFIADMAQAYAWADLVVCRAGALTLAELCAVGVGSVLVPFPLAVDDHQTKNAQFLVDRDAARLLTQSDALATQLADTLRSLADRTALLRMAQSARALARPDAAERVAAVVMEVAR